ncbi:MAG: BrnT family toxin [Lachnospiraceae bacterium]|nr:BrnT family toxin [Lachnospiraceae bacterium]
MQNCASHNGAVSFSIFCENRNINKQKYNVSFETASHIFEDLYYIEMYDFEHSTEEDRYIAIGKFRNVLFVVFTEKKESID